MGISSKYLAHLALQAHPAEIQTDIDSYQAEYGINLVNVQDENGATLAHHFAVCASYRPDWRDCCYVLFSNFPDLNIQDKEQNTPVHLITLLKEFDKRQSHIFKRYFEYAIIGGFNFSLVNKLGSSVYTMLRQLKNTANGYMANSSVIH